MKISGLFAILLLLAVSAEPAFSTNVPPEWTSKLKSCSMVRTDGAVPVNRMPSGTVSFCPTHTPVGNGYLSTVVGSNAIYLAGVYNGPKDHKEV